MQRYCFLSMVLFLLAHLAVAADDSNMSIPAVKKVDTKEVVPLRSVFERRRYNDPLVIKTADEAAKHFDEKNLAKLAEQVDFDRQYVLVFAWGGSGGDRLTHAVDDSDSKQVNFSYTAGFTRDLRWHSYIYVLRSNVKWQVAAARR